MSDWTERAACRGADVEIFYPPSDNHAKLIAKAMEYCNRCPVKQQCRTDALRRGEQHGIWGGTTRNERLRIPERTCTRCGETKGVDDFYARPGRGGGFKSQCKECENAYAAKVRARRKAALEQVKRCSRCKVTKPVDAFDRNHTRDDERATECKDCGTQRYLARRDESREPAKEARCTMCRETRPAAEFSLDKSRPNGLTVWCKPCRNAVKRDRLAARRRAAIADKQCKKCRETKPSTEFHRDALNRTKDGLNAWCKDCNDVAMRAAEERREARKQPA